MKKLIILIIIISFFLSCDYFSLRSYKEWIEGMGIENNYDVYCSGMCSSITNACYWKNGVINNELEDFNLTNQSRVYDIYVYGGDIYSAGHYDALSKACYWKNNEIIPLDGMHARSIVVVDGDVYVAGIYVDGGNRACYWKNGIRYELPGTTPSGVDLTNGDSSIFVVNNGVDHDVYVAGYVSTNYYGCYWKNGEIKFQNTNPNTQLTSIFVYNNDVYFCGTGETGYYKNSIYVNIGGTNKNTIVVEDSDVYTLTSGTDYCKNANSYTVPSASSLYSMTSFNNNLFFIGQIGASYYYWINDRFYQLTDVASLNSIFVVRNRYGSH